MQKTAGVEKEEAAVHFTSPGGLKRPLPFPNERLLHVKCVSQLQNWSALLLKYSMSVFIKSNQNKEMCLMYLIRSLRKLAVVHQVKFDLVLLLVLLLQALAESCEWKRENETVVTSEL